MSSKGTIAKGSGIQQVLRHLRLAGGSVERAHFQKILLAVYKTKGNASVAKRRMERWGWIQTRVHLNAQGSVALLKSEARATTGGQEATVVVRDGR
jgi:hypothetical protein